MRAMAIAVGFMSLVAATASADTMPSAGLGPIRMGMSFDEVRAPLPGAKWRAGGDPEISEALYIAASAALAIGTASYDVTYQDREWGAFHLSVGNAGLSATNSASCRSHVEALLAAIEKANGTLAPVPNSGSNDAVGDFRVVAERKQDSVRVSVTGSWTGAVTPPAQACVIRAEIDFVPPRPPAGDVPAERLIFAVPPSIGVLHHSLDLVTLPDAPVTVELDCVMAKFSGRLACRAVDPAAKDDPFVQAALFRTKQTRVAPRTSEGRWVSGEHTRLRVVLRREERRGDVALTPEFTREEDLVRLDRPSPRLRVRYPLAALDAGVSASLTFDCVIQTDGSLICPKIAVNPPKFEQEFIAAAMVEIGAVRFASKLKNGAPSAGVHMRQIISFRLE